MYHHHQLPSLLTASASKEKKLIDRFQAPVIISNYLCGFSLFFFTEIVEAEDRAGQGRDIGSLENNKDGEVSALTPANNAEPGKIFPLAVAL